MESPKLNNWIKLQINDQDTDIYYNTYQKIFTKSKPPNKYIFINNGENEEKYIENLYYDTCDDVWIIKYDTDELYSLVNKVNYDCRLEQKDSNNFKIFKSIIKLGLYTKLMNTTGFGSAYTSPYMIAPQLVLNTIDPLLSGLFWAYSDGECYKYHFGKEYNSFLNFKLENKYWQFNKITSEFVEITDNLINKF